MRRIGHAASWRSGFFLFLALFVTVLAAAGDGAEDWDRREEDFVFVDAADTEATEPEQCARLQNEAPEDTNSGFPTFVAARPSVVLDLSRCTGPPAVPRVNFAAQRAGGRASAVFTQGGFAAGAVIDGIASEPSNGWAYLGRLDEAVFTITFSQGSTAGDPNDKESINVEGAESPGSSTRGVPAARIVIVSGSGQADHHLTSFRLWVSPIEGVDSTGAEEEDPTARWAEDGKDILWRKIPGCISQNPAVVVAEDGVSVSVKAGEGEVVLDFPPLLISSLRIKVEALRISLKHPACSHSI